MREFEVVAQHHRQHPDKNIEIPERATQKSAGYDVKTPIDITLAPKTYSDIIWTDLKVQLEDDEVAVLHIRSSIGVKRKCFLANTTGIIDADYYENESNDGNIAFILYNNSDEVVEIKEGERVVQIILQKYLTVASDATTVERKGGIGSTT